VGQKTRDACKHGSLVKFVKLTLSCLCNSLPFCAPDRDIMEEKQTLQDWPTAGTRGKRREGLIRRPPSRTEAYCTVLESYHYQVVL
jgi:hypothetical protein